MGAALAADAEKVVAAGRSMDRRLFGIVADIEHWGDVAIWEQGTRFVEASRSPAAAHAGVIAPEQVWIGDGVQIDPFVNCAPSKAGPAATEVDMRLSLFPRTMGMNSMAKTMK